MASVEATESAFLLTTELSAYLNLSEWRAVGNCGIASPLGLFTLLLPNRYHNDSHQCSEKNTNQVTTLT